MINLTLIALSDAMPKVILLAISKIGYSIELCYWKINMNTFKQSMEWQSLFTHQQFIATQRMQDWFEQDPNRFEKFSLHCGEIFLDYSKNRITSETLQLLCRLAEKCQLKQKIEALFTGQTINFTEKTPALHTALRNFNPEPLFLNNQDVKQHIRTALDKMRVFSDRIRQKTWLGFTGKPIKDIVNIGIGGSYLGPLMATHALEAYASKDLTCHFISNIDPKHIQAILKKINPETTLFIISSKSFTTLETITNAQTLMTWLQNQLGAQALAAHFVAITAATERAVTFGIPRENTFTLWDWVGGRYSIWSTIGLPLAILIGMDPFLEFLRGAEQMDQHFRQADLSHNMPVIMALLGIWYINFFNTHHHAIVPYSHHLNYLRQYLQQLEMESNGKQISHHGGEIDFHTCPVIFGDQGCNGQHSFHQLLHQGRHLIPVDFILTGSDPSELDHHHDILIASGLSQAQALMRGKSYLETFNELQNTGIDEAECHFLAKHKSIPGNRPSNVLFINRITPHNLGALIALYEHKTVVQGIIWQINSFDQWGVELGKKLLPSILEDITSKNRSASIASDSSTKGLIQHYKSLRNTL